MAYLRWSYSNWYVYSHADAGDLDDAVLACLHGRHRFLLTAGELRHQAVDPDGLVLRGLLREHMAGEDLCDPDWQEIHGAVQQFLKDVYLAGKLRMPEDIAERYRALRWQLAQKGSMQLEAWDEIRRIDDAYPPPDLPSTVRQLKQRRALRLLTGEVVAPEQDEDELKVIHEAQRRIDLWPAIVDDDGP